MSYESTLNAVRELSENAMLRPPLKKLRLARPEDRRAGPRPAVATYEELHPPVLLKPIGRASDRDARRHVPKKVRCPQCNHEPDFCRCGGKHLEDGNDFLVRALGKTLGMDSAA